MDTEPTTAAKLDEHFMRLALEEADKAGRRGEVPVGAVIVDARHKILAAAGNISIEKNDPTGHAEIAAMRAAGEKTGNYRLLNTTLYVTIEPCVMCAGAMVHARVGRLVYGASDPKAGGVVSCYQVGSNSRLNHQIRIKGNVLAAECAQLLKSFFKKKRGQHI